MSDESLVYTVPEAGKLLKMSESEAAEQALNKFREPKP